MLAVLSTCLGALGQGKILFANDSLHLFTLNGNALPISPLPSGHTLLAVLYAGGTAANLTLQTSVTLDASGMIAPGRMVNKPVILTLPGGMPVYFQVFVLESGATRPATITGGAGREVFVGTTYYFGTSGLFTAVPGTSLSYPHLATSASSSTWEARPVEIMTCLSCNPFFLVYPSNAVVSLGGHVTFSALAMSYYPYPPVRYQWRKQGSPIPGATNSSLTLGDVTLSHAGNYDVVASTIYGSTASPVATLTVFIPAIAATLGSPTYTPNNQFQFTLTGTAGSNYVVQVSTNLAAADWISIFTNASPFTLVDSNENNFPQRFYRAYCP